MEITAIAAFDRNRLLAGPDGLPWELPRDVAHFRQYTNGHHMVLGRTTFEEMTGWFDRQIPLVLTSREDYDASPGQAIGSLEEGIAIASQAGEDNLIIGGGGKVYQTALPRLTQMVITRVEAEFSGNTFFPQWDKSQWEVVEQQEYPADEEHSHPFRIETWRRV